MSLITSAYIERNADSVPQLLSEAATIVPVLSELPFDEMGDAMLWLGRNDEDICEIKQKLVDGYHNIDTSDLDDRSRAIYDATCDFCLAIAVDWPEQDQVDGCLNRLVRLLYPDHVSPRTRADA